MDILQQRIYSNDYADIILPFHYTTSQGFVDFFAKYSPQIINQQYALLHVPVDIQSQYNPGQFLYSAIPNLFTLLDTLSLEASGILQAQIQPALQLNGENILMGFIDTGISYTHPAFQTSSGTSRIVRIWDQTIPSETNAGPFGYGTEYTKEEIDKALRSDNPLEVVPSTDTNGHGTFLAGVAAGTPNLQADFTGVAPMSQIAVVKLKEAKQHLKDFYFHSSNAPVYQENDIMTAIEYLFRLSRDLNLPLVLCLGLGSNQGDHLGTTPLDISIQNLSFYPGVILVAAAGNEAGKAHHFTSNVTSSEPISVEILVPENSDGFFVELWGNPPELFSVGFRSPIGETIARIPARLNESETIEFFLQDTKIYLTYELVQNTSGSQLVFIRFERPTPGIWTIDVYAAYQITGNFHMWLPISNFLSPDITFVTPNPYTTITTPANTPFIITTAAYDAVTKSIFLNSSRGFTRNNQVKPDFAAPGVNLTGPNLRNGYTTQTGTSASAALTAGCCALFMQWGKKRNPNQYYSTTELKNFFIRGADRSLPITYPSREWGYGTLNLYNIFTTLTS